MPPPLLLKCTRNKDLESSVLEYLWSVSHASVLGLEHAQWRRAGEAYILAAASGATRELFLSHPA